MAIFLCIAWHETFEWVDYIRYFMYAIFSSIKIEFRFLKYKNLNRISNCVSIKKNLSNTHTYVFMYIYTLYYHCCGTISYKLKYFIPRLLWFKNNTFNVEYYIAIKAFQSNIKILNSKF